MYMSNVNMLILIVSIALVMLFIRLTPVTLFAGLELPLFFKKWLSYIPPAILSALTASELLVRKNSIDFSFSNIFLIAAIPTFIIAFYTKSLFLTLTLGILMVALIRYGLNYV